MFKSIFTKYLTAFACIIVASFLLLAAIISSMMVDYYSTTVEKELYDGAESIRYMLERRYGKSEGESLSVLLGNNREDINEIYGITTKYLDDTGLFVTDSAGRILAAVGFPADIAVEGVIPAEVSDAVAKDTYRNTHGNLSGILPGKYNICGRAILHENVPVGAVFFCTSTNSISRLTGTTVRTIIMTCLWVLLAALIAVYFITEKIVAPLKDMSRAAKSYASGKFDVRIPVTGRDEIAELSMAFNNMAGSLADLENMRSTFLSNVSHDLRTPMTTISGFIDGILDGTIPQEKQEYYLRLIGDEVRRLSRLVAALLDVSRIQAGDRKFVMGVFDICEMARVILISFEQKIDKKHLEVEFDAEEENLYAWADHDAIYQILYNICDNAVKFSKDGGRYRVKILRREKNLYVSVYNEGEGIRSEDLPHVFDRFYKGDKSRGLDKTGIGLGLYIARSIIDAHKQEIWVKSKYGEYCEFIFTLQEATDAQIKKAFSKEVKSLPDGSNATAGGKKEKP